MDLLLNVNRRASPVPWGSVCLPQLPKTAGCSGRRKVGGRRELAVFWMGRVKSRRRGTSFPYFCIKDLLVPGQRGG